MLSKSLQDNILAGKELVEELPWLGEYVGRVVGERVLPADRPDPNSTLSQLASSTASSIASSANKAYEKRQSSAKSEDCASRYSGQTKEVEPAARATSRRHGASSTR